MSIIGQVPPFLTDAAGIVTAFVVILGGIGVISRFRAFRWLWRRNVSDPLGRWGKSFVVDGATVVVETWHREHVEPVLTDLSEKVDKATAWAEVLAEREGLPVVSDPRTLRRNGGGRAA